MLKVIGAGCVVLFGAMMGIRASERLSKRHKKLFSFYLLSEEISERMQMGDELFKIYSCEKARGLLVVDGYTVTVLDDGLYKEDKELLCGFFERLGMYELEAAVKNCSVLSGLLLKKTNDAEVEMRSKSRLYSALGLFGGIFAALILI